MGPGDINFKTCFHSANSDHLVFIVPTMSALLRARFPASIVSASAKGVPTRSNAGLSRLSMLSISPARSFMTSSPYLAAATKAKAKKDTITTAKKSVKKPAAKKAAAPKKKKVVKKVKEVGALSLQF